MTGSIVRSVLLSGRGRRPSKPWGCRSKTLTPTPEPAGYCAGDVAGERGAPPPSDRRLQPTRPRCLPGADRPRSGVRPRTRFGSRAASLTGAMPVSEAGGKSLSRSSRTSRAEVDEIRDFGDRTFARGRLRGQGAGSGASIERAMWLANEWRDEQDRSGGAPSGARPRPSKPPASRSRRCRRRTWRSCEPPSRRGTRGTWMPFVSCTTPTSIVRTPEDWPEPGPFVGREAVMRQFEQLRETWDADAAGTDQRLHRRRRPSRREVHLAWRRPRP